MTEHELLRVAVLMGGNSAEKEISLASGICVAAALEEAGHAVRAINPAEVDLREVEWRQFDVCFISLHGGEGEDGRTQKLLDALGVGYTGSGPHASHLALCKTSAKQRFREWNVPTPDSVTLHSTESIGEMFQRCAPLGYPLIVKPDEQGSSLGVNLVRDHDGFQRAVAEGQFYGRFLLAERYIPGREFTVALIDDEVLPVLEILSPSPLFTYQGKYRNAGTEFQFETGLTPAERRLLEQTALQAAKSLGTAGLVRVDLRMDAAGQLWVLEVNTIPGMTEQSLVPRAAAQAGLGMPALCDRLLRMSLAVAAQKSLAS
jgi:D-alanine-D-alanine ligase